MSPKNVSRQLVSNDFAIYAAFFASGMAGLIYEISWSRQIGLLFGHTAHASAIVIACFFTGMALGYALAARYIRWGPALRSYAIAEWIVAGWACLVPFLLDLLKLPFPAELLHHASFQVQTMVRLGVCFLILLPATVGLGATLPFIAEYLSPENAPAPRRIARAYAINTLGALLGVVLATAVLFLTVGVRGSGWLAAAISALSGWVVFQQSKKPDRPRSKAGKPPKSRGAKHLGNTPTQREPAFLWPCLAILSGFGTLALQVLYIHLFALVLHNSTYTFGAVLIVFLGGLAIGASLAHRLLKRYRVRSVMAWACMLSAVTLTLSLGLFLLATRLESFDHGQSFAGHMVAVIALVAMVVGPSIVLLGLILPVTWYGATQGHQGSGRVVGTLTAANTLASTVGSLLAAFVLIPVIGVWTSFLAVAATFFVSGAALIWKESKRTPVLATGVLSLCLGTGALLGL